ncbi:MAG: glycosyltransferase family 4 protein [Acidobacteriota bacterium]
MAAPLKRSSMIAPWVLIAGGFHQQGGMDKANAALAQYLIKQGVQVHLVAHHLDTLFYHQEGVMVHKVKRPVGSFFLGDWQLAWHGQQVAKQITNQWPAARVLVNGGNCAWPDINWVHSVHHAWPCSDLGAPLWFKAKNRLIKELARRQERRSIGKARIVLANSQRTRRDLINYLKIDPNLVHTVYLGSDPNWGAITPAERVQARAQLGIVDERPLVIFVGALSHDQNKGLDILWSAWQQLSTQTDWDAELIVAGGGNGLVTWQRTIAQAGMAGRIHLLGFTNRVGELLAAADLLVSPVRYEAYGLNVQEAICRGIPALVSGQAGIAERYGAELKEMVLCDPENVADLSAKLIRWRANISYWQEQFLPLATLLRRHSWHDMASQIFALASSYQRVFSTNGEREGENNPS